MDNKIQEDLTATKKKLSEYIDKGRTVHTPEVRIGHMVTLKPEMDRLMPLKPTKSYGGSFLAVDCSTKPLMRANNWGIYFLRTAYVSVSPERKEVQWDHAERISTAIGEAISRGTQLENMRFEYESKLALSLLKDFGLDEKDYLLLDGASLFGTKRRFSVSLYEESRKRSIRLLAMAKRSPSLLDEKGRDFMVAVETSTAEPTWVYHPVVKADFHRHLYGDVSITKLNASTPRMFRCDIMQYLTDRKVDKLLSPLTSISEDPRCLGYPVCLFLAHNFSKLSAHSKLLHYLDLVEEELDNEGILDILRKEEHSSNFRNELNGIRYSFDGGVSWLV